MQQRAMGKPQQKESLMPVLLIGWKRRLSLRDLCDFMGQGQGEFGGENMVGGIVWQEVIFEATPQL